MSAATPATTVAAPPTTVAPPATSAQATTAQATTVSAPATTATPATTPAATTVSAPATTVSAPPTTASATPTTVSNPPTTVSTPPPSSVSPSSVTTPPSSVSTSTTSISTSPSTSSTKSVQGHTSTQPTTTHTDPPSSTDTYIYYTPVSYPIETSTSSGYTREYTPTTVNAEFTSTWVTTSMTYYSSSSHMTIFTVTTVFEPGAVITVGALSVIQPKRSNIAPIVGGVVGGILGLVLIFLFYWYFLRQRSYKYNFASIFDPGRLSGRHHAASGNPPTTNVVDEEEDDGMGGRLASTVVGGGVVTPFVYNPSSAAMSSVSRAPLTGQRTNTTTTSLSQYTSGASTPGSPVMSRFSEAGSFSSGPAGVGYANPFETGPSLGHTRSESNTTSSGVYQPRSAKEAEVMRLLGPHTTNPTDDDVLAPRASPFYPSNPGGAGMDDDPYPGYPQGGNPGSSFARSTALPPGALRSGPRYGSGVVVRPGGGGMEMRGNVQGVPEEEEPRAEIPPTYSSLVQGERR